VHALNFAVGFFQLFIPTTDVLCHLFLDLKDAVVDVSTFLFQLSATMNQFLVLLTYSVHCCQRVFGSIELNSEGYDFFIAGKL